jgi:hypothetical protein
MRLSSRNACPQAQGRRLWLAEHIRFIATMLSEGLHIDGCTHEAACLIVRCSAIAIVLLASIVALDVCSGAPRTGSALAYRDEAVAANAGLIERLKERDFITRDSSYLEQRVIFGNRLSALASKLASFQSSGSDMTCTTQVYLQARWLYNSTADWVELNRQLVRSDESLRKNGELTPPDKTGQHSISKTCYSQWFLKGEATLVALEVLYDAGRAPSVLISRPEPINTPQKLEAYLNTLLVSDIARTGRDNRAELAGLTTNLSAAVFKRSLRQSLENTFKPLSGKTGPASFSELAMVYERFIRQWQDPKTGYWGAWYKSGGRIYKTADLSITYHTIAYRNGQVSYWPRIIDTTLSISNDPYPYGWLHDGHFTNHNNYDVARILRYGWAHMTARQRQLASDAIKRMLTWTLNESMNPEGTFKSDPTFFSSLAADYYFGVSFLDVIGFWDSGKRFWTNAEFPDAINICRRIKTRLMKLQLHDYQAVVALKRLNASCGPVAALRR